MNISSENTTAIIVGEVYVHYKNREEYRVAELIPLKINGEWTKCVIYASVKNGAIYSRPITDFKEKFSLTNYELKRRIFNTVTKLVIDFLYHDRETDKELPREVIQNAIKGGSITTAEIVDHFEIEFLKAL